MPTALDQPFIFGCLALDIAGFKAADIDPDAMTQNPDDDFRLLFGIDERLSLSFGYENQYRLYTIAGIIPKSHRNDALSELALKLNEIYLEQNRGFSIDPNSDDLVFKHFVGADRVQLEDLAEAIADVAQTVLALSAHEGAKDESEPSNIDWGSVVRG